MTLGVDPKEREKAMSGKPPMLILKLFIMISIGTLIAIVSAVESITFSLTYQ
jgi:hypothetical protein